MSGQVIASYCTLGKWNLLFSPTFMALKLITCMEQELSCVIRCSSYLYTMYNMH